MKQYITHGTQLGISDFTWQSTRKVALICEPDHFKLTVQANTRDNWLLEMSFTLIYNSQMSLELEKNSTGQRPNI